MSCSAAKAHARLALLLPLGRARAVLRDVGQGGSRALASPIRRIALEIRLGGAIGATLVLPEGEQRRFGRRVPGYGSRDRTLCVLLLYQALHIGRVAVVARSRAYRCSP